MFEAEYKWYFIMMAVVMSAIMVGAGVDSWQKSSCKVEYAKTTRTVAEINEICK
jgi:hypothetical protein